MDLFVDLSGGIPLVRIAGDLRLWGKQDVADQMRESVHSLITAGHKRVVMNLSGVRRIDSRGIGCLARIHATATSSNAVIGLVLSPGIVKDALDQLHFMKIYPVFPDEAAAVAGLPKPN